MNGGLSYQVADPPFATPGPRLPHVRAPPIRRAVPNTPKG
jgi:hypothetical protein